MERIELNPYVKGNEISLSLMRFAVKIIINKNSHGIYHELTVFDSDQNTLTFNFFTFEDAIAFTQNIVNKSHDFNEIISKYEEEYEKNKFKGPRVEQADPETSKISLTPDEVDEAIIGYYGDGKNYRVSVEEELGIDFKGNPTIHFYLIEHLDYDGIKKDHKGMLTESDIKTALNDYISLYNYEIIDFKYIGGIHRVGLYIDEETPHYDGIELRVKEKEKPYRLTLNRNSKDEKRN